MTNWADAAYRRRAALWAVFMGGLWVGILGGIGATTRDHIMNKLIAAISGFGVWAYSFAQAQITPGGIDMQPANSALAEEVRFFHNDVLMPIITIISIFVLALLLWVMWRYNAKANPNPSKFSHNTLIEVIWTGVPILILLVIALFSFDLLYKEDVTPDGKQVVAQADGSTTAFSFANDFPKRRMVKSARHLQVMVDNGSGQQVLKNRKDYTISGLGDASIDVTLNEAPASGSSVIIRGGRSIENASGCPSMKRLVDQCQKNVVLAPTMTLKAIGFQWGWTHGYPDFGDFEITSMMLPKEATTDELYLREVDNRILVPVGETIRVSVTARDVIHAWTIPAFAVKVDAVPGRINELWFKADREGVFYGQCSEICGIKHSFMPIAIEVVSRPVFEAWVDEQRTLSGMEPIFALTEIQPAGASAAADTQ